MRYGELEQVGLEIVTPLKEEDYLMEITDYPKRGTFRQSSNHQISKCLQTWLACVGLTTLLLEEPRLLYDAFDELNWMSVFVG